MLVITSTAYTVWLKVTSFTKYLHFLVVHDTVSLMTKSFKNVLLARYFFVNQDAN